MLAVVNFTRHFRHYFPAPKFISIADRRALQWLHNVKDPDALTVRWLEKLSAFDHEVVHRPGKPIGHADGLYRTRLRAFNAIVTEDAAADAPEKDQEWPNHMNESSPDPKYVLQSTDSIAHCILADLSYVSESIEALSDAFQRSTPLKKPLLVESFGHNGSLNRNVLSVT